MSFEEEGKRYQCDFEVVVGKDTGEVMNICSLRHYEVK